MIQKIIVEFIKRRDGIKRKGDKIGMGYIHDWLTNRFEHADTPTPSHNSYYVFAWCANLKLNFL